MRWNIRVIWSQTHINNFAPVFAEGGPDWLSEQECEISAHYANANVTYGVTPEDSLCHHLPSFVFCLG